MKYSKGYISLVNLIFCFSFILIFSFIPVVDTSNPMTATVSGDSYGQISTFRKITENREFDL